MCESDENFAIFGQQICFSYTKSEPILKGIDLNVKKGTIYGLLGSSGCGKTTLLKCILGRLETISGEIKVFGFKSGSKQSHIPGAGVGYMPQELALYSEFTTHEILTYFGKIYAMNSLEIREKAQKLMKLLDLKNKNKLIGRQSGGQQRRISLACTLIHSPPLLILDEPTVGTDPLLRYSIWLYLRQLTLEGQTIILTTHYIEEARNANTVAFMRSGKILAEDEPNLLLNKYESNNLEDVFLKLCHSEGNCYENQTVEQNTEMDDNNNNTNNISTEEIKVSQKELSPYKNKLNEKDDCMDVSLEMRSNQIKNDPISVRNSRFKERLSALLHKNYVRIIRDWQNLLLKMLISSILVILVLVSIGTGSQGINIAICDEEIINNKTERWGEVFVEHLDKNIFNVIFYDTIDEAIDSVKSGQNTAAIEINERLTKALRLRFLYMSEAHENTLDESQIYVYVDRSDPITGLQIERYLYLSYLNFVQDVANRTNINTNFLKIPLVFEEPIYGDTKGSLREFSTPGIYIALTFYVTSLMTAHVLIEERVDGLFERSIVAGITAIEFILSNIITQVFIVCFQILFLLLLPYIVLGQQINGSIFLFGSLLFLQGFCGVCFGISLAIIFTDMILAEMTLVSWFIASVSTAGVLFPLNFMPYSFQFISKLMPNTMAIQSLRDIMYRQWTIDYTEVYMGFIVTFIWIILFLFISVTIFRKKQ